MCLIFLFKSFSVLLSVFVFIYFDFFWGGKYIFLYRELRVFNPICLIFWLKLMLIVYMFWKVIW